VNPEQFLRIGPMTTTRTLVVCVGDSITQGTLSANYVEMLDSHLSDAGYQFVNAGVNGNLAENVLRRLDDAIACRPDIVTILVGTNDVAAHINDKWMRGYLRRNKPLRPLTAEEYGNVLGEMVFRLTALTTARLALIEIPVLGEDLDSPENERVRRYNDVLHEVANAQGIPVLPLNDRMTALLAIQGALPRFNGSQGVIARASLSRRLLRRRWNDISRRNGLQLLTDHIHLNDRGAGIIADLITEFLRSVPSVPARRSP